MNWFWFAIITMFAWSGSDIFSKVGCYGEKDKTAHLKMVLAVGVVMGLHAAYMVFVNDVVISLDIIWRYLPVSLLYILSMALGYIGLRYIELSISSPICNSSGALVALMCIIMGAMSDYTANETTVIGIAVAVICCGVVGLGIVEAREDDDLRARRQEKSNRKYAKSWLALCLPIAYCLLDAAGTFADSLVLETLNEDSANVAYELTFSFAGLCCLIFLLCKREKFTFKQEWPKYTAACFETVGQLTYIYALADEEHVMMSAPIISAYCVVSSIWAAIFLKERLSWKHYAMIALVIVGIIVLGIYDI